MMIITVPITIKITITRRIKITIVIAVTTFIIPCNFEFAFEFISYLPMKFVNFLKSRLSF